MTLVAYLHGSDEASVIRLGDVGLTTNADGSVGFGGIVFDDPDKRLTVRGWMEIEVHETACLDAPVLFRGWIGDRKVGRSSGDRTYKSGVSRFIDTNLVDPNDAATFRMFVNADAKRPAENDDRRIRYALGGAVGGLSGLVDDDGLVNTAPNPFPADDLRGRYAADAIGDMADALGKIKYVYVDPVTAEFHLFYDFPTATVSTCTLSISNDMADKSAICFYPLIDAVQGLDPSEMASIVRYVYLNGVVLEGNTTTYANFFSAAATGGSDLGNRGIQIESDRVGEEATARHHAQVYLSQHSTERDTITVPVIVPAAQVGLIRAGMRISNKFTHLDGHEAFGYSRIQSCTINHWVRNDEYLVTLELTNSANRGTGGGTGGGGTGDVPAPPPTGPTIVQKVFALADTLTRTVTLPVPPTVGNYLVLGVSSRGTSITLPAGWTEHSHGQITPGADYGRMAYRPVVAGESADIEVTATGARQAMVWEVNALGALDTSSFAEADTGTQPASINAGTLSPTAGLNAIAFLFLIQHNSDWGGNGPTTMSTPTGWTTDGEYEVTVNGDLHPNVQADSRLINPTTGTYGTSSTIGGAGFNYGGWGGLAMVFGADAAGVPPQPLQDSGWEVPVFDPDGPPYTWRTAHPFADRTLEIKLDDNPQTSAIIAYDGACGDFQVGFEVYEGEQLLVRYQAR